MREINLMFIGKQRYSMKIKVWEGIEGHVITDLSLMKCYVSEMKSGIAWQTVMSFYRKR